MVKLVLPPHLLDRLPESGRLASRTAELRYLRPGPWSELVREIRESFPLLANRVLTESGAVSDGFVLVVNDEIVAGNFHALELRSGDELSIIAALAGG